MENKILKHLINAFINKKFRNPERQRKFLIDCIDSHGYVSQSYRPQQESLESLENSEDSEDSESLESLYRHIIPSETTTTSSIIIDSPDFQQTFNSPTSVDPYGFNRTFINAGNSKDKLSELQKRGITYEETQFNEVQEQITTIIAKLFVGKMDIDQERIVSTALNIYLNIIIYYRTNPFGFKENKGSLKRGYIFLSIYYSLVYNNNYTPRDVLSEISNINLSDIPAAEKNIKIIFNGINGYDFIYYYQKNFKNFLKSTVNIDSRELVSQIKNVIEATRSFIPSNSLGIYSIIYFVCNYYYPFRVKIKFQSTETTVTYTLLNEVFEPFASATVRKLTDQLRTFYKK